MISSLIQFFYPDIKKEEMLKFSLLALALFFILGAYWALRLLKDLVIYKLAFPAVFGWNPDFGRSLAPKLKWITPFVVACVVIVYTKLLDIFEKHKLFYIFCTFYAILFAITSTILCIGSYAGIEYIGKYPLAVLGIIVYLATESFGSLVIALFWSFTISSTKNEEAGRSFPFIIAMAQLGTIGGASLLLTPLASWILYALCTLSIILVMVVIRYLIAHIPADQMVSDKIEKKQKPDILAGLRLLITQPYLLGVFVVSTFYEIVKTIVDYQMKSQAALLPAINFQNFLGWFGFWTNVLAFSMALLGTSYIIKRFGLKFCILLYPIAFGSSLTALYIYYLTNPSPENLLWATFGVMMLVTALSYAVNNPTKDMMYIPTSNNAKFKVKGITDTIGSRGSKATGSLITDSCNVAGNTTASLTNIMSIGTLIGLGFISIWLVAAWYVGTKNAQLIKNNQIVE